MLSRIAESLFWIGRYLERAEDTARILDVHMQLLVEDPAVEEEAACRSLLSVMGVDHDLDRCNQAAVMRLLAHDPASPSSIVAVLEAARESARRARETVSADVWESINTTWNAAGQLRTMRPHPAFRWVRERVAVITGLADSTMSHDEGWQFLVLGRSIERADMTARLLSTASMSAGPTTAWPTALRACGAYEAFLRTYRGLEADRQAAEFLLLDRLFPRSIVHALSRAERCLMNLASTGQRVGFGDEALRQLGRARAELEYRSLSEILKDLPAEMERVQRTCTSASEAVSSHYFAGAVAQSWTGGTP